MVWQGWRQPAPGGSRICCDGSGENPWLGGKAALLADRGYRFDMGPTILTLPSVLRRVFEEAGRRLEDYLTMIRLDPQWRCFFEDGSQFDLVESLPEMQQHLREFTGGRKPGVVMKSSCPFLDSWMTFRSDSSLEECGWDC